ncbi:sugar transferase [Polynucleobacter sp. AP-Feld-500C-C5]|uniref:sugar transferase n=1 Tax=Polynucleobacter sp. AP-Feld-500C-C5 TaxID=2576924 RepID=UPI001C0DC109|nr:sugar transferase [Polynucleobacter sp. AP-Feld-500C-C5]MBU3632906.1 sugar transferase [Polynucleobacter sp. AP-Feld-500C-C5]
MKRSFDIFIGFLALSALSIPMLIIALLVKISSRGPVLHWSDRVGYKNCIFKMPKFRTMKVNTPQMATHLLGSPQEYLTPLGSFLRKCSVDELPQLWSILVGHMSFVGPRPALFSQEDLIALRTDFGIDKLVPGLTGWAQVNGRDNLSIEEKVRYELEYLKMQSFWFDLKILTLTFFRVTKQTGIIH